MASAMPTARAAAAEEPSPEGAPAGTLPEPRPSDPPTHTKIAPGELGQHLGETLHVQMKDGRMLVGILRSADDETIRLERDMGLGTSAFRIRLTDVDQVLKRLP